MQAKNRINVALDVDSPDKAIALAEKLASFVGGFKVGLEFITSMIIAIITARDVEQSAPIAFKIRELFRLIKDKVFWDGKFDDIPNTVKAAVRALGLLQPRILNVHASSSMQSMIAAVKAAKGKSQVFVVTVLTSYDENNAHLDFGKPSKAAVLQFARNAKLAGCTGIICSPQELTLLDAQEELGGLRRMTPGIRASNAPADDQKRTLPPRLAMRYGADELVIGRPITSAESPSDAAKTIANEIEEGLKDRLSLVLFNLGHIQFGAFRLKLHDTKPDAPLSPIYLNIRDLPEWVYTLAGDVLHDLIVRQDIGEFDYVIGIPKAGEPIGRAVAKALGKPLLRIEKVEADGNRKISTKILDPFEPGKRVLLVDDLVTKAHTKREAIESVEANGLQVVGTVVLYDREQGGLKELNDSGRKVFAARRLSEALDLFVEEKKINAAKRDEVMAYVAAN